jgi:hypothetical protein
METFVLHGQVAQAVISGTATRAIIVGSFDPL